MIGLACKGRQGFGNPSDILWSKASKLQRRELIKKEIQKGEEEECAWTRWEGVTELKISWEDLWKVEPVRMQFMLKSTYDLLPTPDLERYMEIDHFHGAAMWSVYRIKGSKHPLKHGSY